MNHVGYLGAVVVTLALGVAIRWLDPSVLAQLTRRTGLSRRRGWTLATAGLAWVYLPLFLGAEPGGRQLWLAGSAVAGIGVLLATLAATSLDEYRLLRRADVVEPEAAGDRVGTLVATSGTPVPDPGDDPPPETPFEGHPAVHAVWLVQRFEWVGFRHAWQNVARGVRSLPFTLGDGAVAVRPGRHRVFATTERLVEYEPSVALPEPAAAFMADHPDLPSPDERDAPLRIVETYVPADEPVTVVGVPERTTGSGAVRIDRAPGDALLGTHADHAAADETPEAVLLSGNATAARSGLRRRIRWLGAAGLVASLGGQAVAIWLSAASLPTPV